MRITGLNYVFFLVASTLAQRQIFIIHIIDISLNNF